MTKFTENEIIFIKSHLDKSNLWIGNQLKRTVDSIAHKIAKLSLKKIYNQKKHNDLSNVLSESELAYCLGVLAADGCITYKKNKNGTVVKRIAFTLAIKDSDFLISIFKILTGDIINFRIVPPSIGKENKIAYTCSLPEFIDIAEKFGITRNKSKTLNVSLDDKSFNFKYYFLRGVIDGDGHIPNRFAKISIVSASKEFIDCLNRNFKGLISKRNYGDYWDFSLDHSEDRNLPKEPYMLNRKNERLNKIQLHVM